MNIFVNGRKILEKIFGVDNLNDVKIIENPGRYGSKSHYVNIILKTSSKPINITFAKKEICEKIRELLLKKYKEQKKIK